MTAVEPTKVAALLALTLLLAACAPTSLSPHVVRYGPLDAEAGGNSALALRTGPRLSTEIAASPGTRSPPLDTTNPWATPQWGLAYDWSYDYPITFRTALHVGAQGEFYYPFPLPAYGVYVGLSHARTIGPFAIAPACTVHGATDFGLTSIGGPGTQFGAEANLSLSLHAEERVWIALVPFVSYEHVISVREADGVYAGVALYARVDHLELSGGLGRVWLENKTWIVPIAGVRGRGD